MNKCDDFPLLLPRELSDLLNDFICAHNANLSIFTASGKLCGKTTTLRYAIFGVSFGVGLEGRAGVSVSG
jgi:hypothetical protein